MTKPFSVAARGGIDVPVSARGADQHLARGGAGGAQPLVEHRGRHRGAFLLDGRLLPEGDLVGRLPVTNRTLTRSQSASSSSARIWGRAVYEPCPTSGCESPSVTCPSGAMTIQSVISWSAAPADCARDGRLRRHQQAGGSGEQKAARQGRRHVASLVQFHRTSSLVTKLERRFIRRRRPAPIRAQVAGDCWRVWVEPGQRGRI